jgi:hypothetical protein
MGHSINYVVGLGGCASNGTLCQGHAASACELEEFSRERMLWEFSLPGSPMREAPTSRPTLQLCSAFPSSIRGSFTVILNRRRLSTSSSPPCESYCRPPITRIDELLVLDWAGSRGPDWLQDQQQVDALVDWLRDKTRATGSSSSSNSTGCGYLCTAQELSATYLAQTYADRIRGPIELPGGTTGRV